MRPAYLPPRRDSSTTAAQTSTLSASSTTTVTLAPDMNVAQHDLLRLTASDAGHHLGGHLNMDAFDPDMNFEPEGLLCVLLPLLS